MVLIQCLAIVPAIYTLDDLTFKDIQTGFAEVVSEIGVVPKKEENIEKCI